MYTHMHTHDTRFTSKCKKMNNLIILQITELNYHEISFIHKNDKQLKSMIIPNVGKELEQLK